MAKARDDSAVYVRPDPLCPARLEYRHEGVSTLSTARCGRLVNHEGDHRSASGKVWSDKPVKKAKKK